MKAIEIPDWDRNVPHFSRSEFPVIADHDIRYPEGKRGLSVLNYLDAEFVMELASSFRAPLGKRVFCSPIAAGWVRWHGSTRSQHYAGKGRLVRAGDLFPEGLPWDAWMTALQGPWGGIGFYLDTRGPDGRPWVMFHLDLRNRDKQGRPTVWARVDGAYIYPTANENQRRRFGDALRMLCSRGNRKHR